MPVKERMRRVDLILQIVSSLHQQHLPKLLGILRLPQRLKQRQRVKSKPNLRRILIDFVNRTQQRGQRSGPRFFIVFCKKIIKWSHVNSRNYVVKFRSEEHTSELQ